MHTTNLDLLNEINIISKIHTLQRDDIDTIMIEFADRITKTLHLERLSVWILNPQKDAVVSMGEYHGPTKAFFRDNTLKRNDFPNYFKSIAENEILIAENVYDNDATKELSESYFKPLNIISLMDIPLRIEGELVGIMCYEKEGDVERHFTDKEQLFALSVGLVFASNLEARQRRAIQYDLDRELKEKDVLIKEINHRVKNNISVISSLLSLQSKKSKDDYHRNLIDECKSKIDAISTIHEITYKNNSYSNVDIEALIRNLVHELLDFYKDDFRNISIEFDVEPISINVDRAIPLALIINEVITNAHKHAFPNRASGKINLSLIEVEDKYVLSIRDNGVGIDLKNAGENSLGIEIIQGLTDQIDGKMSYKNSNGTIFTLVF